MFTYFIVLWNSMPGLYDSNAKEDKTCGLNCWQWALSVYYSLESKLWYNAFIPATCNRICQLFTTEYCLLFISTRIHTHTHAHTDTHAHAHTRCRYLLFNFSLRRAESWLACVSSLQMRNTESTGRSSVTEEQRAPLGSVTLERHPMPPAFL